MADTFTKVTTQGYGSRIRESFTSVIIGVVLVLASFGGLFWNEGRTVKRAKTLEAGQGMVVTVAADQVDAGNDGKLVHMTGDAVTDDTLKDAEFGVALNAIKLKRVAEMYQWQEEKHEQTKTTTGGKKETTTTYTYDKKWSESRIDSSRFEHSSGHQNPGTMRFQGEEWTAGKVAVGAFTLSPGLVGGIDNWSEVPLDDAALKKVPGGLRKEVKLAGEWFYVGQEPTEPAIGDIRVKYEAALPTVVSLVSEQVKGTFEPYQMDTGSIELLQVGTHTAQAMFETAKQQNVMIAWLIRLGGFVAMLIGITMIFRPLVTVADVVPLFGSMLGAGVFVFALLMSLALSLLTISVAWIFYRPLIGVPLVVVAVGAFAALVVMGMRKRKAAG
ncbi:MAG TPA: TMEM43 family protein [bacterium]|nr:TMEM43 family protein [bacterium]